MVKKNCSEGEKEPQREVNSNEGKKSRDSEEKDVEKWEYFRKTIAIVTIILIAIVIVAFYLSQ